MFLATYLSLKLQKFSTFQSTLKDKLMNWGCKKESSQCQNKNKGLTSLKRPKKLNKSAVYSKGRKIVLVFDCQIKQRWRNRNNFFYLTFQKNLENLDRGIGFSTFALLHLKWCIPVGAAGTHNICVCTYHQNVKSILVAMNSSHNYRQITEVWMWCWQLQLYDGALWCLPRFTSGKVIFEKRIVKNNQSRWDNSVQPMGQHWLEPALAKQESKFDEFIENLVQNFGKLIEHH